MLSLQHLNIGIGNKVEKCKIIFISNVTLGYSSPKYLSFIKLAQKKIENVEIETYERWDHLRPKYLIPDLVNVKRNILSGWLQKIKPKNNNLLIKVIRRLSLIVSEMNMIRGIIKKSKNEKLIVVTTFENPLFGLFESRSNIGILQNYSEIWGEDSANPFDKLQNFFSKGLINKYRDSVKWCVSPQQDRLRLATQLYPNAKQYLVLNCPSLNDKVVDKNFDEIKVLYQGAIGETNYPIELMHDLAKLSEYYEVHFAGKVADKYKIVFDEIVNKSSIIVHGYLNQFDLNTLRNECNVGLVYWDESNLNTKYCAPNKLFEFISCGYFVISSKNHSLNQFYSDYQFGLNIDVGSTDIIEEIKNTNIVDFERVSNSNKKHYIESLNFEFQNKLLIQELLNFIRVDKH